MPAFVGGTPRGALGQGKPSPYKPCLVMATPRCATCCGRSPITHEKPRTYQTALLRILRVEPQLSITAIALREN